jgi:hypothetical protein
MNSPKNSTIKIYKNKDKEIQVNLEGDSIWLDTHKIAKIFDIDRTGIVRHINNIYKTKELLKKTTCAKIAQVASDGKQRKMDLYNLDIIISVGYRVNSKQATKFRIWATNLLKDHLVQGYTINKNLIEKNKLKEFEKTIKLFTQTINDKELQNDEAQGLLKIITDYSNAWLLLQKYDETNSKLYLLK